MATRRRRRPDRALAEGARAAGNRPASTVRFRRLGARIASVLMRCRDAGAPSPSRAPTAALATAFDELAEQAGAAFAIALGDYPMLFQAVIADRGAPAGSPACACASSACSKRGCKRSDRVVLGGLVEGVWPPETRSDPWLSRPMRHELGLDLPERRIGLSAHDFAQALGAPDVILPRRQGRRRADRGLALRAAAGGRRRRGTLGAR